MARAVYYDTETTGVRYAEDRIIEIAAFSPNGGDTYDALINPGIPIPEEASRIHGITDAMVADAKSFAEVGAAFVEFCGEDAILIAHNNNAFDQPFLEAEFERHGVELPEFRYVDTLKWARRYRPDLPRHALQFLREAYDVPANNAHRALDDVMVLHEVFSQMIDDLDIEMVWQLMQQAGSVQHMPFGKHRGTPLAELPRDYLKWLQGSGALEKRENSDLKTSLEKLGALA
jgi:DNA polymerase III subunit epsilon